MRREESDSSGEEEERKPRYKINAQLVDYMIDHKAPTEETKKKTKDSQMLPDQGSASAAELKRELAKVAGNPQLAVSILGTLVRKVPDNEKVEYTLQRARLCLDLQRVDEAIKDLAALPSNPVAKLLTAKAYLQKDLDVAASIEYFRARALLPAPTPESEDVGQLVCRKMARVVCNPCFYIAGSNVNFTVGDGTENSVIKPKILPELKGRVVCGVACGSFHTIVLVSSCTHAFEAKGCPEGGVRECNGGNDVFGWGANRSGQVLGFQTPDPITHPAIVGQLIGRKAFAISAAAELSCAMLATGEVAVWGYSPMMGDSHFKILQERVTGAIAAGQDFVVASKANVLCVWGIIHAGDTTAVESPASGSWATFPAKAEIIKLAAGNSHAIALTADGEVYTIGCGPVGQLGLGRDVKCAATLSKVQVRDTIVGLGSGPCLSLAMSLDTAFIWGQTASNQDDPQSRKFYIEIDWTPSYITLQSDSPLEEVSISAHELLALDQSGKIFVREVSYAKRIRDPHPHFSSITDVRKLASGRSMHCIVTSVFLPELCKISQCPEQVAAEEPFLMTIELRDQFGLVCPSTTHLRFIFKRGEEPDPSRKVTFNSQSDMPYMSEYKAVPETKTVVVSMIPKLFGTFQMHIFINEGQVMNSPVRLVITPTPEQLQRAQEEEEGMRKEKEAMAAREAANKKKEEEKTAAQKFAEEESSKRRTDTSKRAQDALKSQRERDLQDKKRADEERKAKLELKTGGGFDLDKARSAGRGKRK